MPPKGAALHRPITRRNGNDTDHQECSNNPRLPLGSSSSSLPHLETLASTPAISAHETLTENPAPTITVPTKKRGRGASTGKSIEREILRNGKKLLEIEFPEGLKKPIKYSSLLANGIGVIVRHSPELNFTSTWKNVPEMSKLPVMAGLDMWFDIKGLGRDLEIDSIIDGMFDEKYKHWKSRLSKKHKELCKKGVDPKAAAPYDWITLDKWHDLCDVFDDPKFQEKSETNSKNRSKMPYAHASGSKAFCTRMMEMEEPSYIDNYGNTHMKINEEYVNKEAEQNHNQMKSLRSKAIENGNPFSERDIMKEVLGECNGYERGLGSGVISRKAKKRSRCDSEQLSAAQEKLNRAEKELQEAVSLIKSQKVTMQSQQEQILSNNEERQKQDEKIGMLEEGQKELKQLMMSFCSQKLA